MGLSVSRLPEFDLGIMVFEGRVTGQELLKFFRAMEPIAESRWLNFMRRGADISDMDLLSITELKRDLAGKLAAELGDREFRSAIVCESALSDPIVRLWTAYLGRDERHPAKPAILTHLEDAFDHLDLPQPGRDAARAVIGLHPPDTQLKTSACG